MNKLFFLPLFFALIFRAPQVTFAEFSCKSEVIYKWKPGEEEEVIEESWIKLEKKGGAEAEVKKSIEADIKRETEKASNTCKRKHENIAGCISSKYSSMQNVISEMSFTARRSLEEAMTEDCKQSQGKCMGASAKEIHCEEEKEDVAEGEEAAEKKEDKKKKK